MGWPFPFRRLLNVAALLPTMICGLITAYHITLALRLQREPDQIELAHFFWLLAVWGLLGFALTGWFFGIFWRRSNAPNGTGRTETRDR